MQSMVSFRELDFLGEGLVRDYAKKTHRWNGMCLDIEGFITDYLGHSIVYENISEEDKSKLGFLADGISPLRVTRDRKEIMVVFPEGTIVIEKYLIGDDEAARRRFTLAHEAAHIILKKHAPMQAEPCFQAEYDSGICYTREDILRMFSINEACANRLGAALLMPEYRVERALRKFNNGNQILCYGGVFPQRERLIVQKMANALGVSMTAMINRLKELKLLQCQPIEQYIREELCFGGKCDDRR